MAGDWETGDDCYYPDKPCQFAADYAELRQEFAELWARILELVGKEGFSSKEQLNIFTVLAEPS